eukprot:13116369-Alexandrium_andersonii.AAC.1
MQDCSPQLHLHATERFPHAVVGRAPWPSIMPRLRERSFGQRRQRPPEPPEDFVQAAPPTAATST